MSGKSRKGKYDDLVAAYVDAYWRTHYRPPTIRAVAAGVNCKSTSQILLTLIQLKMRDAVPPWVKKAIRDESYDYPSAYASRD